MNFPTVIVLLIVLALVALAIKTLRSGKGRCSCGGDCDKKSRSGCEHCNSTSCPFHRQ